MLNDTYQSPSVSWSDSLPDLWPSNQIVLAGVIGVFGLVIAAAWNNKSLSGDLPVLHGAPIIGHFRFFSERYTFVNDGLRKLGSAFQFKILNVSFLTLVCDVLIISYICLLSTGSSQSPGNRVGRTS